MSDSDVSTRSRVESNNSEIKIIKSKLKKHRLKRTGKLLEIAPTEAELKYRKNFEKFNVVNDLHDWILCTKCQTSFNQDILEGKEIHSHPLLKVLMCKGCCDYYGDGEFSLDEDGEDKYCRWCGEGGKLFLCSKCICGFCPDCIKKHFGSKKVIEIEKDDDWVCYLCNPEPLWKLRTICQLAQKESKSNRDQNKKDFSESMRKTGRRDKSSDPNQEVVSSKQYFKESSKHDSSVEIDRVRSSRYIRRSNRLQEHDKSGGDILSSYSQNGIGPAYKKRKIARDSKEKDGNRLIKGNGRKRRRSSKSSWSSSSVSLSSESDEDEIGVSDSKFERRCTNNVAKNQHAVKLKEILKIAEITSHLCFKLCKKEFRKMDRRNYIMSNEKLISNCENLKSMIILMSSSLSTVHSMIISLQRKFGDKGADALFGGGGTTSLLKTISHVLMDKRVKTSHLVGIVNDILNKYPYIEMGASLIRDSVCENHTKYEGINGGFTGTSQEEDPVISQFGSGESGSNDKRINYSLDNNIDIPGKCESGSPRETSSTERLRYDSDVSTDIFESDNRSVAGNDGQTTNNTGSVWDDLSPVGRSDEEVKKDNDCESDVDMKKLYENSLKLKEQLLKDSSEESSPIDSETSDFSTSGSFRDRKVKGRTGKEAVGRKNRDLSKEERELKRLTNLRSLERIGKSHDSDSDSDQSSERSSRNRRESDRKSEEANEKEASPDNISGSKGDDHSTDEIQLPGPLNEIDFIKQCSSLLKEYILKTSSSESEIEEKTEKIAEKTKKKIYRPKKEVRSSKSEDSSYEEKENRKRVRKSSKTDSSSSSDDQETEIKTADSSDDSTNSFKPFKRKKRKSKPEMSEGSDSSCVTLENTSKPSVESPGKGRRTIRKILKKGSLQLETRQAIKMENERKKRMAERNECYKKFFPDMTNSDRLVLDFDRETGEVLIEVPRELVQYLKPHQKEGIKFMWDNCFESLTSLEENSGSGCILAHCMGLGKTFQVITLIATLMSNNLGVDTTLILCPLNVVNNWVQEFKLWLDNVNVDIEVYNIVRYKKYERNYQIRQWHKDGGVLILSYDMLRILTLLPEKAKSESAPAPRLHECLLDPGPDLVVCDEGHVMKNEDTSLARAIRRMKTSRRIVLTGTPFQNNLLEYHSMIQFIKPNFLGTKREFMNRFANPIRNGQFEDSTAADVKLMRARAHVLHKLLDGCIQRFSYSVLTPFLPQKHEYVISVRLTETQAQLYKYYVEKCKKGTVNKKGTKLFADFHWLQKVWTHPELVRAYMEEREEKNGREGDASSSDESVICVEVDGTEKAYWKTVVRPEEYQDISSSGKLLLLFDIIKLCRRIGDKVLVFSQSLKNLDLIEDFLREVNMANSSDNESVSRIGIPKEYFDTWVTGEDYFRMDGSTSSDMRSKWCKRFNNSKNTRARLFLISTRAGGLGINLVGANRVVIFDASWNPSHDVQSIFRVYRFGQTKPCYIYRFVAEATMEEKIYERQVTKLSLEKRVLDEHQIERHYTMGNLQELYKFHPLEKGKWPVPIVPKDLVLAEILKIRRDVIVTYHEHDSLLENKEEEELTEEERKAAWEDFEKEKFLIENQLEKRGLPVPLGGQGMDRLTMEVLRITKMAKAPPPAVPCFIPSQTHNFSNFPLRIVNVQSLVDTFPAASTSQGHSFRNFM